MTLTVETASWRFFANLCALARTGSAESMRPLRDEGVREILPFAMRHKIESTVVGYSALTRPLLLYLASVWNIQRDELLPYAHAMQQIESFTFVQGFYRNNDFPGIIPPANRGDIDVFVSHADISAFDRLMSDLGFSRYGLIDQRLVDLESIGDFGDLETIEAASSKPTAWSKVLDVDLPSIPYPFDIETAYGPIYVIDGKPRLVLIVERSNQFRIGHRAPARWDAIIGADRSYDARYGVWINGNASFALQCAVRAYNAPWACEYRLRPLLEFCVKVSEILRCCSARDQLRSMATSIDFDEGLSVLAGGVCELDEGYSSIFEQLNIYPKTDVNWMRRFRETQFASSP